MGGTRTGALISVLTGIVGCHATGEITGGATTTPSAGAQPDASATGIGGASAGAVGGPGAAGSTDAATGEDVPASGDAEAMTAVLALTTGEGAPLTDITALVVTINQDDIARTMSFPHDPAQAIDNQKLVMLSVALGPSKSGAAIFIVSARNAGGCTVATGLVNVTLLPQATVSADVLLLRQQDCPSADAAAPEAGAPDGGAFPGCDPVSPDCPGEMICAVSCAARTASCMTGGAGAHGTTCTSNADCAPGTQCLDYAASGCAVKVCRHFCVTEANCPQPLQLGLPRNACAVAFSCSGAATPFSSCTVSCDPTALARAEGNDTCPATLSCLLVDPDHADCACAPPTRTKAEGQACVSADDCAPGLVCNLVGAARTCRAICRCSLEDTACAAVTEDCPAGKHCAPLVGGTVFGACVP